jgi:hypothetical protein
MTNEERIAEFMHTETWGYSWDKTPGVMKDAWREKARSLLTFLDSLGFVQYEWTDRPTRWGSWWVSAFCDGDYREPHIYQVIDYERPGRGLEVEYGHMNYVAVDEFVTEYYPKAKWCYIPRPILPAQEKRE